MAAKKKDRSAAAASSPLPRRLLGLVLVLVLVVCIFFLPGHHVKEKIADILHLAQNSGPLGLAIFLLSHILLIILCFPGTILFEWGAGLLFGLGGGFAMVLTAK